MSIATSQYSASVDLNNLNRLVLNGITSKNQSRHSVAFEDINGDGIGGVIIMEVNIKCHL